MAGFYPDPVGYRIPYDMDGTEGAIINSDLTTLRTPSLSGASMRSLNSENFSNISYTSGNRWLGFLFPRKMDISAIFACTAVSGGGSRSLRYSQDATNFLDGTWSTTSYNLINGTEGLPALRSKITPLDLEGVKAIAIQGSSLSSSSTDMAICHIYGKPSIGESSDRLALWHPTLDEEVGPAYFDWGDAKRSSVLSRDFRVKNLSSVYSAEETMVSLEVVTDTSPSISLGYSFAKQSDPGNFQSTQLISEITPGGISEILTVRYAPPSNAALGLGWARIIVEPGEML